jgi:hypothetical protein
MISFLLHLHNSLENTLAVALYHLALIAPLAGAIRMREGQGVPFWREYTAPQVMERRAYSARRPEEYQ